MQIYKEFGINEVHLGRNVYFVGNITTKLFIPNFERLRAGVYTCGVIYGNGTREELMNADAFLLKILGIEINYSLNTHYTHNTDIISP